MRPAVRPPWPGVHRLGNERAWWQTAGIDPLGVAQKFIDPNVAPVRALARDERELMIAANNSHVLAFDNLSGMPPWLSDALCRTRQRREPGGAPALHR